MRYGLILPNAGPCGDPRTLAQFAALAENAGWDGVFLEDYLVYQNQVGVPTYDPWVCLAAVAMGTSRVRLGTMVTPVPRRRVQKLAAECVALDHLSAGRVVLGVGLGDQTDASLTAFGDAPSAAVRGRQLDESLEALVGLWSGEAFSYMAEFVRIDHATLAPKPLQQPRIPIWVGGRYPNPRAVARAARWDGACLFKSVSAEDVTPVDWTPGDLQALRAEVGRQRSLDGYDIAIGGRERAANWDAERRLIAELAEAGATWWIEWVRHGSREEMQPAIERGPLRGSAAAPAG
jgi:alkanesulfonate monooxygenase SsuD/methylene tetrahydromethanopterin reductase-like flavin-dependent oxidoreductase (luciferase family)